MTDPRPLRQSRRLQGRELEVNPWTHSIRHTPLRCLRPIAFTLSESGRSHERPSKRRRLNPPLIEVESDPARDNWIDYLPIGFPFAIYTPLAPPSLKRQRVSSPPFPYFDPNSPTFGQPTPPLMDESASST